jgi:hypothetical protein
VPHTEPIRCSNYRALQITPKRLAQKRIPEPRDSIHNGWHSRKARGQRAEQNRLDRNVVDYVWSKAAIQSPERYQQQEVSQRISFGPIETKRHELQAILLDLLSFLDRAAAGSDDHVVARFSRRKRKRKSMRQEKPSHIDDNQQTPKSAQVEAFDFSLHDDPLR